MVKAGTSSPKAQKKTRLGDFDPAEFVAWLERTGHQVYAWDSRGDGKLGWIIEEPKKAGTYDIAEMLDQYGQFRGDSNGNCRLVDYLVATDRIATREQPPGKPGKRSSRGRK